MIQYPIDLHTHTVASNHAYSTIQENAAAAKSRGLTTIAMTDHGPSMPGGPHIYHFGNLRIMPDYIDGIEILCGVEANILSTSGELDLEDKLLAKLDIVIAGFHRGTPYSGTTIDDHTQAAISAIQSGKIDVLCHPGNPEYPLHYAEVLKAAKEHNVAIEFNNSSFLKSRRGSVDNCHQILKLAREIEVFISLGSDAHISFDVGRIDIVTQIAADINYPQNRIINSDRSFLADFLK